MSDTERWQSAPMPSHQQNVTDQGAAAQLGARPRVSADSFKTLISRLNISKEIRMSVVTHEAAPVPPLRPTLPEVSDPFIAPVETVIPVPVAELPLVEAALPPTEAAVPTAFNEIIDLTASTVPVVPVDMSAAIPAEIPARDEVIVEKAGSYPLPKSSLATPPPILPPPEPLKPVAVVATNEPINFPRRSKSTEDAELEAIMRKIAAVPSNEERLAFLDTAAALTAQDEIQSRPKGDLAQIEERFLQSVQSGVLNPRHAGRDELPPANLAIPDVEPVEPYDEELEPGVLQESSTKVDLQDGDLTAAPAAQYLDLDAQEASELARTLLDMMAAGAGNSQPHERALAADTLLRILPRLQLKPLVLLADRLSMMDQPPPLLVARLIRDDRIDVSGPLLENSNNVTDVDLVRVITEGTPEQRRVIARRRKLSRLIGDKLIASGESPVLLTLVRNANSEISHDGFLDLVVAAKRDHELMAPLCTRADLPAPFAFELFWIAPVQLRRYILSRFLTDSETLTKILKITLTAQGGEASMDKGFPPPEMVEKGIEQFATGDTIACDEHFANLLSIDAVTVSRIMNDKLGDPLAIMLKAAGVSRAEFASYVGRLKTSDYAVLDLNRDPEELQTLFDQMSFNKARILLTYWDWATRKSGPYAPIN